MINKNDVLREKFFFPSSTLQDLFVYILKLLWTLEGKKKEIEGSFENPEKCHPFYKFH